VLEKVVHLAAEEIILIITEFPKSPEQKRKAVMILI
jgi:hypothetical protein